MNYNEFKEALKKEIEKRLERKAAVSFRTISKMNQVEKESIQIEKTGGKVSPVFSLEDLYGAYAVNEDFGKCVEEVLRIYEKESCVNEKEIPMTCLKGQTLIQNKPSISEGYFSASLEKALFCGLSWISTFSMFYADF